jgi:hypothetical protein
LVTTIVFPFGFGAAVGVGGMVVDVGNGVSVANVAAVVVGDGPVPQPFNESARTAASRIRLANLRTVPSREAIDREVWFCITLFAA